MFDGVGWAPRLVLPREIWHIGRRSLYFLEGRRQASISEPPLLIKKCRSVLYFILGRACTYPEGHPFGERVVECGVQLFVIQLSP